MPNTLIIEVMQRIRLSDGEVTFGWQAHDNYADAFSLGLESLDDFFTNYPSEQALIDNVLDDPAFENCEHDMPVFVSGPSWPQAPKDTPA